MEMQEASLRLPKLKNMTICRVCLRVAGSLQTFLKKQCALSIRNHVFFGFRKALHHCILKHLFCVVKFSASDSHMCAGSPFLLCLVLSLRSLIAKLISTSESQLSWYCVSAPVLQCLYFSVSLPKGPTLLEEHFFPELHGLVVQLLLQPFHHICKSCIFDSTFAL